MSHLHSPDNTVKSAEARVKFCGLPCRVVSYYSIGVSRTAQIRKVRGEDGWQVLPLLNGRCPFEDILRGVKRADAVARATSWIVEGAFPSL